MVFVCKQICVITGECVFFFAQELFKKFAKIVRVQLRGTTGNDGKARPGTIFASEGKIFTHEKLLTKKDKICSIFAAVESKKVSYHTSVNSVSRNMHIHTHTHTHTRPHVLT